MPPACPQTMELDLSNLLPLSSTHTLSLSVCHTKKKKKRLFGCPAFFVT